MRLLQPLVVLALGVASVCASPIAPRASDHKCQTLLEIAESKKDDFSTLIAAVTAAGLADALNTPDDKPLTVFAPLNSAFADLPEETLKSLLLPENKDKLANIIKYHVVAGDVLSSDLKNGEKVKTLNGQTVTIKIKDGKVYVNDAEVVTADIKACNGVIHVIDKVLTPPPKCKTLLQIAGSKKDEFSTLIAAVTAAGLVDELKTPNDKPLTVFAPPNSAFEAIPAETLASLLKPENQDQLKNIILYHVVAGDVLSKDLKDGQKIKALNGDELEVTIKDKKVYINGVEVVSPDIKACNGVIHAVDGVLMPPTM